MPIDLAGNSLGAARSLTIGATTQSFTDWVGYSDTNDFYRFSLSNRSSFSLSLSGLTADADVSLIRDLNNNGVVDSGEVITSSTAAGSSSEYINSTLDSGTYYIRVYPYSGETYYNLGVSAAAIPAIPDNAGNTLSAARQITLGSTTSTYRDWVGSTDTLDFYRFTLANNSNFNLSLSGLAADADVYLTDSVGNTITSSGNGGTTAESIARQLNAGTYYIRVQQYTGNTYYNLGVSAAAIAIPDNAGNTLSAARQITVGSTTSTYRDWVGSTDTLDFYRFTLANSSNFNLSLSGLAADADVYLTDSVGNTITSSGNRGTTAESIARQLNAGTYYIRVQQYTGNTYYNLGVSAAAIAIPDNAGNTLSAARQITVGSTTSTYRDWVGSTDTLDFYRFTLANNSNFNLSLSGLAADADVYLTDSVGNTITSSVNSGTTAESIARQLNAGTYYIRVQQYTGNTYYNLGVSAAAIAIPDNAGNTLNTARQITVGSTTSTYTDWVGSTDTLDFYRFTLANNSNFNLSLSGLAADADVYLTDSVGNTITSSGNRGTTAESIARQLNAGTYYIRVQQYSGNTYYNLGVSTAAIPITPDNAGNTLSAARQIAVSSTTSTYTDWVGSTDTNDFYRFNVSQSGVFTANLSGLSADADVRLIQDRNNNGLIDQGEVMAWQWERGATNESIRRFLTTGNYFMQVMSYNNQNTNYSVATNFTAAASDNRRFSIQINFGTGSSALSQSMRNAVQEAARFWENVIGYSSFNTSHTLTIDVGATEQQWSNGGGVLASAGPRSIQQDASQRWMPTTGISNINSNPGAVSYLSSNIDYFRRVMIHEFGHVLGIGTLWGSESYARNLVNRTTGTYNANTYAGWAYGELRGTYAQTAIPVTTGIGPGSDYSHWREQVFNSELMTHEAESPGQSMALSQMTIASLRDLGWNVNYGAAEAYSLPV